MAAIPLNGPNILGVFFTYIYLAAVVLGLFIELGKGKQGTNSPFYIKIIGGE